jgi:hypothetical protein
MRKTIAPDVYRSHHRDGKFLACRRDAGKEPVDVGVVCKMKYELVDDTIDTNCP